MIIPLHTYPYILQSIGIHIGHIKFQRIDDTPLMHIYEESLYLLAMLDYVSRVNHVPLCSEYSDIRSTKLDRVVYSSSVLMLCRMTKSEEPKVKARKEAIPEFMRFNIAEADVRNVV